MNPEEIANLALQAAMGLAMTAPAYCLGRLIGRQLEGPKVDVVAQPVNHPVFEPEFRMVATKRGPRWIDNRTGKVKKWEDWGTDVWTN